jgi:hypothetical protein
VLLPQSDPLFPWFSGNPVTNGGSGFESHVFTDGHSRAKMFSSMPERQR